MQAIRIKAGKLTDKFGTIIGPNILGGFDCEVHPHCSWRDAPNPYDATIQLVLVESEFERIPYDRSYFDE